MSNYAHIVTSIPVGSKVNVYACGRFRQFTEVMRGNAIVITGSRSAYPISVSVRPHTVATPVNGGIGNIRTPIDPRTIRDYTRTGGNFNFIIQNVFEYNPSGEEKFLNQGDAWVEVHQANAPSDPATDIVQRYMCTVCNKEIDHVGTICDTCMAPKIMCEEASIGANGSPITCHAVLYKDTGMCKYHANLRGLVKEISNNKKRGKAKVKAAKRAKKASKSNGSATPRRRGKYRPRVSLKNIELEKGNGKQNVCRVEARCG